jgi:signal transduction histidine kinase
LIEVGGETCVLSFVLDITDRKRVEQATQAAERLSVMGRRLLQAQEEERTTIARELHDHIERLTLLAIDLDRGHHTPPESVAELSQNIDEVRGEIEDLIVDIQTLSNRLHSSELEYLGLAKAVARFCKEFSDQKTIEIDFASDGVPEELPQEISLCLFRVLQGALQSAATSYGSARRLHVSLRGGSSELTLAVGDVALGFDPDDVLNGPELQPFLRAFGRGVEVVRNRRSFDLEKDSARNSTSSPVGSVEAPASA